MEVTKHDPGAFSWAELATSDSAGAKGFYGKLFDWKHTDSPAGPDMVYTTLQKGGKPVGALYQMGPQEKGMPPHWNTYFTVKSGGRRREKGGRRRREDHDAAVRRHGRPGGWP